MIYYIYYHSASLEQENKKVLEFIKTFRGWAILSTSFFLVSRDDERNNDTDANLIFIRNEMRKVTSQSDEFFIGQLGTESVWQGYGGRLRDWFIKNSVPRTIDEEEQFNRNIPGIHSRTTDEKEDSPEAPSNE